VGRCEAEANRKQDKELIDLRKQQKERGVALRRESKCAPAIMRKMTDQQVGLWNCLYSKFVEELKILEKCGKKKPTLVGNVEVIAHNMACEAIWELGTLHIVEVKEKRGDAARIAKEINLTHMQSASIFKKESEFLLAGDGCLHYVKVHPDKKTSRITMIPGSILFDALCDYIKNKKKQLSKGVK
jgi:hypothetical protein